MGSWRQDQLDAIKILLLAIEDGSGNDKIQDVQIYPEAEFSGYPAVRVLTGSQETEVHSNKAVQVTRNYTLHLYVEKSGTNKTKENSYDIINKIIDDIVTQFNGNLALTANTKWTEIEHADPVFEGDKQDMIRVDFNLKVISIDATSCSS